MVKGDRNGGRRDREVESERRRCERDDGDTGKTMKHKGKHEPRVTNFFIKNNIYLPSLTILFYRNNEKEVMMKRRDVSVSSRDGVSG